MLHILDVIDDTAADFLMNNRKDEVVTEKYIENAVKNGDITIDMMVEQFRKVLEDNLGHLEGEAS
jgi:hypothetical protein